MTIIGTAFYMYMSEDKTQDELVLERIKELRLAINHHFQINSSTKVRERVYDWQAERDAGEEGNAHLAAGGHLQQDRESRAIESGYKRHSLPESVGGEEEPSESPGPGDGDQYGQYLLLRVHIFES